MKNTPVVLIVDDSYSPAQLAALFARVGEALPTMHQSPAVTAEPISFVADKASPPPYESLPAKPAASLSDLVEKMRVSDYGAMPPQPVGKIHAQCGCGPEVACDKCAGLQAGDRVTYVGRKPVDIDGLAGLYYGLCGTVKTKPGLRSPHVEVEWDCQVWRNGFSKPRISYPKVSDLARHYKQPEPKPQPKPQPPLPEIVSDLMTTGFSVSVHGGFRLVRLRQSLSHEGDGTGYRAVIRHGGMNSHANGEDPMTAIYNAVKLSLRQ